MYWRIVNGVLTNSIKGGYVVGDGVKILSETYYKCRLDDGREFDRRKNDFDVEGNFATGIVHISRHNELTVNIGENKYKCSITVDDVLKVIDNDKFTEVIFVVKESETIMGVFIANFKKGGLNYVIGEKFQESDDELHKIGRYSDGFLDFRRV